MKPLILSLLALVLVALVAVACGPGSPAPEPASFLDGMKCAAPGPDTQVTRIKAVMARDLLSADVLAQDKPAAQETPEETFKKIESKYADAKAAAMVISVLVETLPDGAKEPLQEKLEGEYFIKTGRKVRLGMWGKLEGEDHKVNLAADGKFMAVAVSGMEKHHAKKAPENLMTDMAAAIARTGLFTAIYMTMGLKAGTGADGNPPDLRVTFPVSGFKTEAAETLEVRSGKTLKETLKIDCKSLSLQIKIAERNQVCDVRIWYNEKLTIIKRKLSLELTSKEGKTAKNSVTETFENVEFYEDADKIPDDHFLMPK